MPVDLVTREKKLESLMLEEYPGKIFGGQVAKSGEGEDKVFYFLGLDYGELTKFLTQHPYCKFRILKHSTGREIENNRNFINPEFFH